MALAEREEAYRPAVGYLRRSTDRQEQSIGDQRKAIERYAEENGFDVLDLYTDDAISGTTADERKAFLRLIDDAGAEGCPFRFVLVYDVKRFGRVDNDEAGHYRYLLRRNGIEVVYVSEGFNGDDTDDLLRPVKQWQARQESKDLSRVTIRGLLSRCNDGWWCGGMPPYGYDLAYFGSDGQFQMTVRYAEDCSKLILDEDGNVTREVPRGETLALSKRDRCRLVPSTPERMQVVRNIFSWYAHEGLGYKGIAERLNQQGIPSPRAGNWSAKHGDKWGMTTIRDLLMNPAYVGDLVWNRITFAKFHRITKGEAVVRRGLPATGPEHNRPDDWVVIRDAHPALVSRTIFEQAETKRYLRQRGLGNAKYRGGRGANSLYLLSGMIRCLRCGHQWQGYSTLKGRRRKDGSNIRTRYYACGGYVSKGNSCCQRAVIPQELIEDWVLEQIDVLVQDYLKDGGEAELHRRIELEMAGSSQFDGSALTKVRQAKADAEAKIESLIDNLTAANRDYVDRRIEKLRDEIVGLESQEATLLEQQDQEQQAHALLEQALALVRDVKRLAEVGSTDEKRTLVRAFLREIEYDPGSSSGTAYFWLVPSVNGESAAPGEDDCTRYQGGQPNSDQQASGRSQGEMSSEPLGNDGTRYVMKRKPGRAGASSFELVAGAGTGDAQITRPYRWEVAIGFRMSPRPATTFFGDPGMRKAPPPKKPSRRKVAG